MRTQKEILERLNARKSYDVLGFEWQEYLEALDFEHAKPFLKDGVTKEEWPVSENNWRQMIIEYLPFAWEKAEGERGISANRSIMHMIAWTWLDESPIAQEVQDMFDNNYHNYGKHILEFIGEHYEYKREKKS